MKPTLHRRNSDEEVQDTQPENESPLDSTPPFAPLEEQLGEESTENEWIERIRSISPAKALVATVAGGLFFFITWDSLMREPEDKWIRPEAFSEAFLLWVQEHPVTGIAAIIIVIATAVVFMVPLGTPLTVGCGYIYKGAFGWKLGLALATIVSMGGSALGAVTCFLLGRYLMRDQVRKWIRKYPLFDAIDVGACSDVSE